MLNKHDSLNYVQFWFIVKVMITVFTCRVIPQLYTKLLIVIEGLISSIHVLLAHLLALCCLVPPGPNHHSNYKPFGLIVFSPLFLTLYFLFQFLKIILAYLFNPIFRFFHNAFPYNSISKNFSCIFKLS